MTAPTTAGGAVLPVVQTTAPKRIYLVIGEDCPLDARWDQLAEVTWCEDNIDGNGLEYVRADIAHAPAQAEIDALRAARDSALTAYAVQKRERLEGELTNCEARIREQRAEINRLVALKAAQPELRWCKHCGEGTVAGLCRATGKPVEQDDQARDEDKGCHSCLRADLPASDPTCRDCGHKVAWSNWQPIAIAATKETP